ncbi:MAG: hypothetical protein VYE64_11040 [Planctomycetota bacterium]|nr:hypothetical protein [Planctomycetota bacterium]
MHIKSASFCLAAMALLIIGGSLEAQDQARRQGRGSRGAGQQRMSRSALLRVEAVQEELDISEDQLSELSGMRGRRGSGQRGGDRPGERGERGGDRPGERGERGGDRPGERGERGGERGERGGERGGDRPGERGERGGDRPGERGGSRGSSLERVQAELDQLGEVLDKDQIDRLNQIYVQVAGIAILQDALVAKQLEISEEQVAEMREMRDEMRSELREMARDGDREEMREKFREMNEELGEKMMDVLSDSQQDDLDRMKGKPFELPADAMPQRRGRGRGEGRGSEGRGDRGNGGGGGN